MNEYMTTDEVAKYLRLNPKKIYAMLADGKIPSTKVSGKWLFSKTLIDKWMQDNTFYPNEGLIATFLDRMLIFQGSDDWFLSRVLANIWEKHNYSVVSAGVGSMAGLAALRDGLAHLSGFHVGDKDVSAYIKKGQSLYVLDYATRTQGLIVSEKFAGRIKCLADVIEQKPRFAYRQRGSGTYKLAEKLFEEAAAKIEDVPLLGPFTSHQEIGRAVKTGEADVGLGIRIAAELYDLHFIPLVEEEYKLGIPGIFFGHEAMGKFMDIFFEQSRALARGRASGYSFQSMGKMEIISNPH